MKKHYKKKTHRKGRTSHPSKKKSQVLMAYQGVSIGPFASPF